MEHPEDPQGRYRQQIEVARRLLDQNEDWGERAEWEVLKKGDGWEVIAWRVEHPEGKGPDRYLPWGYSIIELDSRLVAVNYERKG
jgi:restriction endonuclease S subunit